MSYTRLYVDFTETLIGQGRKMGTVHKVRNTVPILRRFLKLINWSKTKKNLYERRDHCYSRNSCAFDTQTIHKSYVTLNPVTKFHYCYVTVEILSPLALKIPLHNSIPLCYHYVTVNIVFGTQIAYSQ